MPAARPTGEATRRDTSAKIVGLMLVRNEENFLPWALSNITEFCDEIVVLDNRSTDQTSAKLACLAAAHGNVRLERIDDPNTSHDYVAGYANTATWVFGVDGDEIYDPVGLARLRNEILSGSLDHAWRVMGHVLHAKSVDLNQRAAAGYLTPAAHSITKLYNMAATSAWREIGRERLHGDAMIFNAGFSKESVVKLYDRDPWDRCDFRCLHLCFFPRSSADAVPASRKNPREERLGQLRQLFERAKYRFAHPFAGRVGHKSHKYARGPLTEVGIGGFGRPRDYADCDPQAASTERLLSSQNI